MSRPFQQEGERPQPAFHDIIKPYIDKSSIITAAATAGGAQMVHYKIGGQ